MKKKITLLSGIILLSFFMAGSIVAQETTQDKKKEAKAKTEMTKKDMSSKCKTCPSLSECTSKAAVKAKSEGCGTCDEKSEKAAATNDKKKVKKQN